jgi:hypothetical protein
MDTELRVKAISQWSGDGNMLLFVFFLKINIYPDLSLRRGIVARDIFKSNRCLRYGLLQRRLCGRKPGNGYPER